MEKYDNIYLIGIGGIGMSAIARYYRFHGKQVSGYDRTASPLTRKLEEEGIRVHYEARPGLLPADKERTLVIYTPAVPDDFEELVRARAAGYTVLKRSRVLGELTRNRRCLAVAGTHGKTSTSTLAAHILTESGAGCSAFLGGISKNYGTNLLLSRAPAVVVEADEYDRSFLQLRPEIAVITAMDADHLDIYGNAAQYRRAFKDFAAQVSGTVIRKYGLDLGPEDTAARLLTYHGSDPRADFHALHARPDGHGHFIYDLSWPGGVIKDIRVGAPGRLNAENSIAAAALCLTYGIDPEAVRKAVGSFLGVARRLDVRLDHPKIAYIDDYAHHPEELSGAIASIREIFPGRRLTGIFQPHLYSRTRDFAEGFAAALSRLDRLLLLDIYPAREAPIPGVSAEMIFRQVTAPEKVLLKKEELLSFLDREEPDVLATFGAGDIDRLVAPITEMLERKLIGG